MTLFELKEKLATMNAAIKADADWIAEKAADPTISMDEIKTKKFAEILNNIKVDTSCLVVLADRDDTVIKSARNLPNVKTALTNTINVYDILKYDKFVVTKEAVEKIQEVYA